MSIKPLIITFGLVALALPQAGHATQDRCATRGSNGYPTYCSPTGEGLAPVWNAAACCRGADCKPHNVRGECSAGRTEFWCEFAELDALGNLTCLYEVADICSVDDCPPADRPGEPLVLCCPYDDFEACFEYEPWLGCDTIWFCLWGASNDDGTYSCMEPEPW